MALGWFDTSVVDAFAQAVMDELTRRLPPALLEESGRKSADRLHRMTEVLSQRIREFGRAQRPNTFKRARLGSRIKEAMKEAGYPAAFIDAFVYEVMTLVTVAAKAPR
jgi:hypothetical protein